MKRTVIRTKGKRWCEVQMEVTNGRFSMSGAYGHIVRREEAEEEAFEYWRSFFEDSPEELGNLVARFPEALSTPGHVSQDACSAAASFVLEMDGALHGLEVYRESRVSDNEDEDLIYLCEGCGQCREEINEWFPEVKPLWKWHLNDMHAECVHQEALGWTYETHPDGVCPAFFCRYRLGSGWTKRKLPENFELVIGAILRPAFPDPTHKSSATSVRVAELLLPQE